MSENLYSSDMLWFYQLILFGSVFIGVSDREKQHKVIRDEKEDKLVKEDLENYNNWLKIAGVCLTFGVS